jgi:hypothetical protein
MRTIAPLLALAIGLVACQDTTNPAEGPQFARASAPRVQRVVGGGSIVREDIAGAPREIYGFQAQVDASGHASGEAEVHFPSDNVKMHIAIKCVAIERNIAWLSGPVTRSDDPLTPVGRVFVWRVQDNGEVQGAPPDRISNFLHRPSDNFPEDVCREKRPLTTFAWDNGNVQILTPGALSLADLVGTWDATVLYFINPDNAADTADLFENGGRMRWTIAPDGRWSQIWWKPGMIFENTAGVMDLVNGQLVMWAGDDPNPEPIACQEMGLRGNTMSARCHVEHGYDWDGDQGDDPSFLVAEMRLKRTGVLVNDLAGTWQATLFRYTSTADPNATVDLVGDLGYSIALAVGLDSRFYVVVEPVGWTSTTDALLVEGDQMLTRNEDASAFVFSLKGGTWSFTGLDAYDFDRNGTMEPATLQVVLMRS